MTNISGLLKSANPAQWHVLFATWLGELFDGMDASIYVLTLYPALSELLHTTSHKEVGLTASIVLAVFMVGWAIGAVVFGMLSDYIGRTRTMLFTILLYAICTGLCALCNNWWELAICRFFVGCGIGGEISIGAVLISECWSGKSRLHAVAALNTSFGCGYLLAALLNLGLGGLGWRPLYVVGVLPALLTVYIRMKLKEPEQFEFVREQRKRLRMKPKHELSESERALITFTLPELFQRQNIGRTLAVIGLASTAIVGYWAVLAWLPAWVNQLTGTAAVAERSITAIVMNIGGITAAAIGGFLIMWLGRAKAFRCMFLGGFVSCVAMYGGIKTFGALLVAASFFVGFFATAPFVLLFIYVPELFPAHLRGTAFGFCVQVGRIAAAAAALAGGQLISMFGGSYAMAGACLAFVYLLGVATSYFMPATKGEVTIAVEPVRADEPQPVYAH